MGFFKSLFGLGPDQKADERQQREQQQQRQFDTLKYDGLRALRTGNPVLAVRFLEKALELHDDLEVREYLSQAYVPIERFDEAIEQLQYLAKAQPDNTDIYVRMAQVAFLNEDYDLMEEVCAEADKVKPELPEVLFCQARAKVGKGDNEAAIGLLNKTLEVNADFADALLLRGQTYLKCGQYGSAHEDAERLTAMLGEHEDVQLLMARVLACEKRYEEAILHYTAIIDNNPFCQPAYQQRGDVYMAKGDKEAALADYNEAANLLHHTGDGNEKLIQQEVEEMLKYNNPFGVF